jgi:hypothetical protein
MNLDVIRAPSFNMETQREKRVGLEDRLDEMVATFDQLKECTNKA